VIVDEAVCAFIPKTQPGHLHGHSEGELKPGGCAPTEGIGAAAGKVQQQAGRGKSAKLKRSGEEGEGAGDSQGLVTRIAHTDSVFAKLIPD
jgi:hypothetical protein